MDSSGLCDLGKEVWVVDGGELTFSDSGGGKLTFSNSGGELTFSDSVKMLVFHRLLLPSLVKDSP